MHLTIWPNWFFGKFYHKRIENLQILDGRFRFRFCVFRYIFFSVLSDFLSQEKLTQTCQEPKAEQFANFQLFCDKIDQITNFAKLSSTKCKLEKVCNMIS